MRLTNFKKKNKILKKLNSKRGFTLVELLCAVFIMVIVAGIMTVGINLGTKSYGETTSTAAAKQLCSILEKTLNDELRTSGTMYVSSTEDDNGCKDLVGIYSKSFGGGDNKNKKTFYVGSDGHLYFGNSSQPSDSLNVLGEKIYSNGIKLKDLEIKVKTDSENKKNTFIVSFKVVNSTGDAELSATAFEVEQLNYHNPIVS